MKAELIFFATPESASWLVDIIIWIVKISSSIALGVVLFTLLLKLVTLPFDIISKIQMRKNSLIMESMRPELEKLQKQYANDKQLYSQKMMALYKKHGYSMMGACLPTIVTLVIFIVAISAFNKYSQYQNKVYFYEMSRAFNTAVYDGIEVDEDLIKKQVEVDEENGIYTIYFDNYKIISSAKESNVIESNGVKYNVELLSDENGTYYTISSENGYVYYKYYYTEDAITSAQTGEYFIMADRLLENEDLRLSDGKNFAEYYSENTAEDIHLAAQNFVKRLGSNKSAANFRATSGERKFLWVKNIWAVDSPMAHPVVSDWEMQAGSGCGCAASSNRAFKNEQAYVANDGEFENMNADRYALLIADLEEEQQTSNGFFILAILTAGISLVAQIVMSKSQKATMELQTVDGRGAEQQKMMMWMMPIMMAVFSFMYTATFSIYMILSQALSIISTFGINFIIDKRFNKIQSEKEPEKIRGRVYTPEVKEEPKKDKKAKKPQEEVPDFINGGKKHIRGRIK